MRFARLYLTEAVRLNEASLIPSGKIHDLMLGTHNDEWRKNLIDFDVERRQDEGDNSDDVQEKAEAFIDKNFVNVSTDLCQQNLDTLILEPLLREGQDDYLQIDHLNSAFLAAISKSMEGLAGPYRYDSNQNIFLAYVKRLSESPSAGDVLTNGGSVTTASLLALIHLIKKKELDLSNGDQMRIFTDKRIFKFSSGCEPLFDMFAQMTDPRYSSQFNPEIMGRKFEDDGIINQMLNAKSVKDALALGNSVKATTKVSKEAKRVNDYYKNNPVKYLKSVLPGYTQQIENVIKNEDNVKKILALYPVTRDTSAGELVSYVLNYIKGTGEAPTEEEITERDKKAQEDEAANSEGPGGNNEVQQNIFN